MYIFFRIYYNNVMFYFFILNKDNSPRRNDHDIEDLS